MRRSGLRRTMAETKEAVMKDNPILICYDGSAEAAHAIGAAAELLGARRATVLDTGPIVTAAESLAMVSMVPAGGVFEEWNKSDARRRAEAGAERAREAGFTAEARAELDAPTWQGIVAVADEIDAAVIVLGSRGLSEAREAFEGSVSHEVVEHSHRPVLIVPPAKSHR